MLYIKSESYKDILSLYPQTLTISWNVAISSNVALSVMARVGRKLPPVHARMYWKALDARGFSLQVP